MTTERLLVGLAAVRREIIRREAGVDPPDSRFNLAVDVLGDLADLLERDADLAGAVLEDLASTLVSDEPALD